MKIISKILILKKFQFFILILLAFYYNIISCTKAPNPTKVNSAQILAIVANDTVFVNDFLRRTEYNVRPPYCDDNQLYDKRVILNSIIAEKLFALEAGDQNEMRNSKKYQNYIQGIKEQAMREALLFDEVQSKIEVSQEEIDQSYLNSKKKVYTEGVFIPDFIDEKKVYKAVKKGMDFDVLSERFPGVSEKIEADVVWGKIDAVAQEAIFSDSVKRGTVLAPLPTERGYRLIKVKGWSEEIEMSSGQINLRKENIRAKLFDYYLLNNTQSYVKNFMKGRRIDFDRDSWGLVHNTLEACYIKIEDNDNKLIARESVEQLQKSESKSFLNVDGTVWTIGQFNDAILIHPLELDIKGITKENFPARLRAAIANLIVDDYLTKDAYKKDYDTKTQLVRKVKQWETFYNFSYQRDRILSKNDYNKPLTKNFIEVFDNYLTPYFDSLKVKYNDKIKFNPQALEKVEITKIPLIAYKTKGPYRSVVPVFPVVTNSIKTNYKHLQKN